MILICSLILMLSMVSTERSDSNDANALLESVKAAQEPLLDFKCEFEGTILHKGEAAKEQKLGDNGLYESYSGIFVWRTGGDTFSDSLHRSASDAGVTRRMLAVRMWEKKSEVYYRHSDAEFGLGDIQSPDKVNSLMQGSYGLIFLVDQLERLINGGGFLYSVTDAELEGRPTKVLELSVVPKPQKAVVARYWIDLARSGHVVRQEHRGKNDELALRLDIKLERFQVDKGSIWMPVAGEYRAFIERSGKGKDGPTYSSVPTLIESIYVNRGSMEFNKRPGNESFTVNYKAGTPISDGLRKLQYQYGQQKIGIRPTKKEAEEMLLAEVSAAEQQKKMLVAASPSHSTDLTALISWVLAAASSIALVVLLWIRRHRG